MPRSLDFRGGHNRLPGVVDAIDVLGRVPLFAGVSREDLGRLGERMREATFPAGDVIVREGTRGARVLAFFVILDGTAAVTFEAAALSTLSAGDYFGEIGLILDTARTATVTAETDLVCSALSAWDFRAFVEEHPGVEAALTRALEARLRQ